MSTATYEDLHSFTFTKTDDPEIRARQGMIAEWALAASPETREKVVREAREEGLREGLREGLLKQARSSLRHVLAGRRLALSPDDEARVDACTDLDTLQRWLDQAIVATSAADVLR
jgi:hypothetical protein